VGFELQAGRGDEEGVVVLSVSGDVDAITAPRLTEEISAQLAANPMTLIVDLSGVDFLASAGMAALARASETAGRTRFAVVADGPVTGRPLRLVGMDLVFKVYPTLGAALA
jgi:anti-sigma B factor antagonist